MISTEMILGIIIIVVGVVTLVRIIKPLFEGIIIIALIFIGSALLFHSTPVLGLPNFNLPVGIGPNIVGASAGTSGTTALIIFNANAISITHFTVNVNNKSVTVLNQNLSIPAAKFGVVIINSSSHGFIALKAYSNLFGFNLIASNTTYNYT